MECSTCSARRSNLLSSLVNLLSNRMTLVVTSLSFRSRWLMWLYWDFNSRVLMSSWERPLPWEKRSSISLTLGVIISMSMSSMLVLVIGEGGLLEKGGLCHKRVARMISFFVFVLGG